MGTLINTVMGELVVACIIDEVILELQQVAFFVKKQAIEPLHAESRFVALARGRTPPLFAAARRTCRLARSAAYFRNLSKLVGHSRVSQIECARVPGMSGGMCDILGQLPSIGCT